MAKDTSQFVAWVKTDYEYYHNMASHEATTLYFLEDTAELYMGDQNYTSSTLVVDNVADLPEYGGQNVAICAGEFYQFNRTTNTWDKIDINVAAQVIVDGIIDKENPSDNAVSAKAVVDYVAANAGESGPSTTDVTTTNEDITVLTAIGAYTVNTTIPTGTDVQTILETMLSKPAVAPAISTFTTGIDSGIEEGVATNANIRVGYRQNDAGAATHMTVTKTIGGLTTTVYDGDYTTETIMSPDCVVTMSQSAVFRVTIDYADGPSTIKAGQLTRSITVSAFRYMYYIADEGKGGTLASVADFEALSKVKMTNNRSFNIDIAVGVNRVVIALPNGHTLATAKSKALGFSVYDTFAQSVVADVQNSTASGYGMNYNLYLYETEIAFPSTDTYEFTTTTS